ncbi:MAG TPA: hypothetical protein PKI68_00835 [Pontiellaceae bacterium]|nr:hypothetical protein [Pontiellaceae bacterium]
MTDLFVKADGGIVWLIVGVFWVIAQIAGAAAKKNQPPRPVAEEEETGAATEDPFAELLRKMAGAENLHIEPPVFIEEPQHKPAFRSSSPWKPGDIEALPDIEPLRHEAPAPEPAAKPAALPEPDLRPKMSAFRNSVPSIKLPTMNLSFQGSETSVRKSSDLGKILNPSDRNSLRRAMLSHIIFSAPKALEQTGKQ